MNSMVVLFQIAGAVALLLFGIGLVRDGATEAFGVRMRMALGLGTRTGPRAFFSGLVATLGLQSSTATALMTASFVDRGLMKERMAQVVLLGANVGTALTAFIVSAGLEAASPLLIFTGYLMARRKSAIWTGTGRALIGLGLMLVSLTMLQFATQFLRDSPELAAFLPMLDTAWPVALFFAASIAVMCSSSLAAVLLIMSLNLPVGLTVVMVLGANLGGAVPAVLATGNLDAGARRVTLGNLVIRAIGCMAVLPFAGKVGESLLQMPIPQTGLAVETHLVFNCILALVIWPFTGLIARLVNTAMPDEGEQKAVGPSWLDESALQTPLLALTGASREVMAIGDAVDEMLTQTRKAFHDNDTAPLAQVDELERRVDRRQQEVKTYLSRLGSSATEDEKRQSITILDYVINLEHVGDIIDRGLGPEVRKKVGLGLRFSNEGYQEIDRMFLMTQENMRLAQSVFLSRDRDMARRLMELKIEIRKHERQSAQRHLIRLREGHEGTRETSSLHLDILRDLKRINAHVVSVAHPILDEEGLLFESRLRSR
ncbi:Na/Pi cotransporter family protein [Paracoccus aestuariivivens]|uniref:Na/Pi cotransporter family protein n=1 Tax=Paracoccus aestuariivivens TaxID=1820333 RepID=A0A6L6J783_9RHOB|nr:Na/Pi cotransporter family protein [Paracoccus aestuariivivens]MTH77035.1 Na/Pi cotransporter family protein [Paracoccus aestuariivivens]